MTAHRDTFKLRAVRVLFDTKLNTSMLMERERRRRSCLANAVELFWKCIPSSRPNSEATSQYMYNSVSIKWLRQDQTCKGHLGSVTLLHGNSTESTKYFTNRKVFILKLNVWPPLHRKLFSPPLTNCSLNNHL